MKNYSIFALCIVLISCEFSVNKKNNATDIETAKKLSFNFYNLIKEKKLNEAAEYFGTTIGYEDGKEILETVNEHLGNLETAEFTNANSNVTASSRNDHAEYNLNFKVKYEKMEANEEIVIELVNDSLKITGYHPRVKVPPAGL